MIKYIIASLLFFSTTYAEDKQTDILGFHWRISSEEANRVAKGRLKVSESENGNVKYKWTKPKNPEGADFIRLSFFENELYQVEVFFSFRNTYDLERKYNGIVRHLKKKHINARVKERLSSLDAVLSKEFSYREEGLENFIENQYNLEAIWVSGVKTKVISGLSVTYHYYGASKITEYLKTLSERKEFGDF